jgi:hypothetical protein
LLRAHLLRSTGCKLIHWRPSGEGGIDFFDKPDLYNFSAAG